MPKRLTMLERAKEAAKAVAYAYDRWRLAELIRRHGATRVSEIPPNKLPRFIHDCRATLKGK